MEQRISLVALGVADGHMWEIAPNPTFTLAEDGSLVLPDFDAA